VTQYDRIQEAARFLEEQGAAPRALVVLGSGLGGFGRDFEDAVSIPYEEVPGFPESTSPGHEGELLLGRSGDVPVMVMSGRFHYYEGHSLAEVALPVRVARALGARTLLITSAVGGMNPKHALGEILVIEDHINLMGASPLHGTNDERLGPRFPDLFEAYDRRLIERAKAVAQGEGLDLQTAVLVAVPGPQLETPAEYRFLRQIGADAVGMSIVPEVIVAAHAGMRVCALSVVTDLCYPEALAPANVEEIIATANAAAPRLEKLLSGLLIHA
jgi:purine-nucleoside phosphorylase